MDIIRQPIFIILACIALAVLLLHFFTRPRRPVTASASVPRPRTAKPSANRPRSAVDPLLTACLGDRARAARLLDFERRRDPSISDLEAQRRALDRLERDRGR